MNKHIMAFINFIALVPLVYFIPDFVGQFLPENKLIQVMVSVALIVPVITYLVVPISLKVIEKLSLSGKSRKF